VVQCFIDPIADEVFYIDEVGNHAVCVQAFMLQFDGDSGIVSMQMCALAGVCLQAVSIAESELA